MCNNFFLQMTISLGAHGLPVILQSVKALFFEWSCLIFIICLVTNLMIFTISCNAYFGIQKNYATPNHIKYVDSAIYNVHELVTRDNPVLAHFHLTCQLVLGIIILNIFVVYFHVKTFFVLSITLLFKFANMNRYFY